MTASTESGGVDLGVSWEVPAALDGERVDRTVSLLTGLTRSLAAEIVAAGRVRVGGGAAVRSGSRRVHRGERLCIDDVADDINAKARQDLSDPSVAVRVVYADDDVIVVDKAAGMVVHPGAGHSRGTLIQGLVARYPDLMAMAGPPLGANALRPGIVHRLDRGSSGLLMVARNEVARAGLVSQLAARTVERRYRALVGGTVASDEGLIDAPLGRSTSDPTRRAVRADGRDARTTYEVATRYGAPFAATLLRCRLETGRTHQIRVHMAAIGHPLVGDGRYGGAMSVPAAADLAKAALEADERADRRPDDRRSDDRRADDRRSDDRRSDDRRPDDRRRGERPWLHAETLGFDHPISAERCRFESPLPDDLVKVLARFDEKPS